MFFLFLADGEDRFFVNDPLVFNRKYIDNTEHNTQAIDKSIDHIE